MTEQKCELPITLEIEAISLRDLFAAFALAGIMTHDTSDYGTFRSNAVAAYKQADAMLEVRENKR